MTRMKKMSLRTYEPEPEEIGGEGRLRRGAGGTSAEDWK